MTTNTPAAATELLASPVQLRNTLRELETRVRAWWKREGLGHTSSVGMTGSGCLELEFSCSPYSEIEERMYEEDAALPPLERQARVIRQFEDRGFVLTAARGHDVSLLDCDKTTATLRALVLGVFPTAVITSLESRGSRSGDIILNSMRVLVRDLSEAFALPEAPKDSDFRYSS